MRKTAHRISPFESPKSSPRKRVLQLSQETVRTLTSDELLQAVSGCPTGSSPTTQQDSGDTCTI